MSEQKQNFLEWMQAAYGGPGSTEEGTFAGAVLRACADAMAELWSMEIDGLARRAFVSHAVGEWLTAVCADRGVERREGESDDSLRARTLEKLASTPASGNADHYKAWCGTVDGLLRVRVLPLNRGCGTVDIVAVGPDGRAPGAAALAQAQAVVDRERPVGADARVVAAAEVPMDVSATVTLMEGGALEEVQAAFAAALGAFCTENALRSHVASFAKILRLLLDCPGVADVTGFTLCGGEDSIPLAEDAVAVCGTLALQEG